MHLYTCKYYNLFTEIIPYGSNSLSSLTASRLTFKWCIRSLFVYSSCTCELGWFHRDSRESSHDVYLTNSKVYVALISSKQMHSGRKFQRMFLSISGQSEITRCHKQCKHSSCDSLIDMGCPRRSDRATLSHIFQNSVLGRDKMFSDVLFST